MELIIHGTGAMGKIVKELAEEKEIQVTGFADELHNEKGEVIIDFSHFSRIKNLLEFAKTKKIPLVLATSGYSEDILEEIKETSKVIPIFLSSNMSLGVNLLQNILKQITPLLYKDYDIEIVEKHHNKKVDAPSGTAKMLLESIEESINSNPKITYGREGTAKREKNEIGVHAIRGGTIVGEHSVLFCGNDEIIEIKHTALSKKIFAEGAIKAAEFLLKKPAGIYTVKDIL